MPSTRAYQQLECKIMCGDRENYHVATADDQIRRTRTKYGCVGLKPYSKYNMGKVKGCPVHAMKTFRGRRGKTPLILDLGTRWRRVVNFTTWQLYPRERNPVPIE
jgi:hypothetical protein